MDHSAKRQHHEQSRKKHKQDRADYARELARRKPSSLALWIMIVGLSIMAIVVIFVLVS